MANKQKSYHCEVYCELCNNMILTPLSLTASFGFGDRLGLATLGHIAAVRDTKFAPIFAQQVINDAKVSVYLILKT